MKVDWEFLRALLLSVSTIGVGWIARMVFVIQLEQRDLRKDVCGDDGKGGMKAQLADLSERLEAIEERNLVLDAVAKIEREEYDGDERRHGLRTLRDLIREELKRTPRAVKA